jgi:predicted dehydrogenase
MSVIHPAESHPEVTLHAIASRDFKKAHNWAKKYGFEKAYGSYEEIISDPDIDFVYISLPNSLHFEWAIKSMENGKHVLCEKPLADNAEQVQIMSECSKRTGKIIMEAFHWKFHPAAHLFRDILRNGGYGKILRTEAAMTSTPAVPPGDIRWQYELGGGSLMDMTYVISFTRYAVEQKTPDAVLFARARKSSEDPRIDEAMNAGLRFVDKEGRVIYSSIYTDMKRSWYFGVLPRVWELPSIMVELEQADVFFYNAMMPHIYHHIEIRDKRTGEVTRKRAYTGGPSWGERGLHWWSTYRYQLEAFVDKVSGREVACWESNRDSLNQMKTVDEVYRQSGLPIRPSTAEKN